MEMAHFNSLSHFLMYGFQERLLFSSESVE